MESRDILKKIKFEGFHRQIDELPGFPNVEELDFGVTRKSFEENADVSAVLPNVSNELGPRGYWPVDTVLTSSVSFPLVLEEALGPSALRG